MYALASNKEYARVMREEVESIVNEEGWTKKSMQKMRKVDSFMKETQRMYGLGAREYLHVNDDSFGLSLNLTSCSWDDAQGRAGLYIL